MNNFWINWSMAFAVVVAIPSASAKAVSKNVTAERWMNIHIKIEGVVLNAALEDNRASRDFAALLPLDLSLSDYNGTEKIGDLPVRLSTDQAPAGVEGRIGDISYFAPWGNLAIFYRNFEYSHGLIRLGRIEGNIDHLRSRGVVRVRIERADHATH